MAMRSELRAGGLDADTEPYPGYSSFAWPYGLILAAAVAPALLPARLRRTRPPLPLPLRARWRSRASCGVTPVSVLLSRREGRSLVATLEARGEARRTLCLVSHLDSSRSGLLFHPAGARLLGRWITLQSLAVLAGAGEPLLARWRPGRWLLAAARWIAAAGLALLAERELRGADVPGANDNASGVAVAARLIAERAEYPLQSTRLVFLATGGEEAGLLGAQEFLRSRDTEGWLFLNFDGVGRAGDPPLPEPGGGLPPLALGRRPGAARDGARRAPPRARPRAPGRPGGPHLRHDARPRRPAAAR